MRSVKLQIELGSFSLRTRQVVLFANFGCFSIQLAGSLFARASLRCSSSVLFPVERTHSAVVLGPRSVPENVPFSTLGRPQEQV